MHFVKELKDENRIWLRWSNERFIIEPKEDMLNIEFPELIKLIGNVKEVN